MDLFDVYPRFDVEVKKAKGSYLFDAGGQPYLDLYGGHGVISIGHSHPIYLQRLKAQLDDIGFYSNAVNMPLQEQLANKLGQMSGYQDYRIFLCNSGAEANENALKLASFHTGKKRVIAFDRAFHGRTAACLNITDNHAISAPLNKSNFPVSFLRLNDEDAVARAFAEQDVAAVILEGIQGVGGLDIPTSNFLSQLRSLCDATGALLILDEIQSGFMRTGSFFAHQPSEIKADLVTVAKGMGNGFPVGGVLVSPRIKASHGLLGTTFGGNPLACVAALVVLETIEEEQLAKNVKEVSSYIISELAKNKSIRRIKGKGLMLGVEFDFSVAHLRRQLLHRYKIFTGASANPNLLRILPPLTITAREIMPFFSALHLLTSN